MPMEMIITIHEWRVRGKKEQKEVKLKETS